jgi:hypothetical protein
VKIHLFEFPAVRQGGGQVGQFVLVTLEYSVDESSSVAAAAVVSVMDTL